MTLGGSSAEEAGQAGQATQSGSQPGSQRGARGWASRRAWLGALVLAIATAAVYAPVIRHEFVNYDDREYVTENAQVQSGLNGETMRYAFTSFEANNWHPLTWLSHARQMFGLDSVAHYGTNLGCTWRMSYYYF